jgi:hypothetical protein
MTKILKTKRFHRWARKAGLTDGALVGAVAAAESGLFDTNLGGGVAKLRVAQPGQGKRGSTRTLLATNFADRWIFIFGYAKHERDNISPKELTALQNYSADLLSLTDKQLEAAVAEKALIEVHDEQTKN